MAKKFIFLLICICLWGCSRSTDQGKGIKIVASYSVLCDLVRQLGAQPQCLISYDRDPHTYEATPQDRKAIETADVIFYGGLNFEPSIIKMVQATNTPAPKIAVHESNKIAVINDDPHIWHDSKNGIIMAEIISQALKEVDPANASLYDRNLQALTQELTLLDRWIVQQINTISTNKRRLVTTHDAFSYYARAYGLKIEGTLLGISTEEEPTPTQVKNLIHRVKQSGVPTLFAELTSNDKVLRNIAKEAGVKISDRVLIADGIGKSGTPEGSYQGMLIYNTCTIVEGLGGKCSPFNP